jgi:hypothetical protein
MTTIVSIQQGGTGANNVADAISALGVLANTGGEFTGEVSFTGSNTSINVSNDAIISGSVTIGQNTNISGNATIDGRGLFGDGIEEHFTEKDIDESTITVAGFANTNAAVEIAVINKANGTLSYAEFIALNDKANQEQGWISIGVNSSEYNDPEYTLTGPDDGYLLFEAPLGTNANGDLIVGTGSYGQNNRIVLAAGGFAPTDAQMTIAPADLKTAVIVNSELTSNVALLTTDETHTFLANDEVIIASVGAPYDGQFTITNVSSNTISYNVTSNNIGSAAATGTATQYLPFNKGTVELTAQLFVGENAKSTFTTANLTLDNTFAIPLGVVVDNDGPGQVSMFNKSNGAFAYSEFIAQNDAADADMGWVSFGINSSNYDDPEFPITKADDAYILYEPPANTTGDGDFIIGTGTNGQKNRLIFAAQGFDEANAQMIITPDESVRISINTDATSSNTGALQVAGGVGIEGSLFVQGNQTIQGDLIVNGSQVTQSIQSVAASGPISLVGDGNIANTWDFGIVGVYANNRTPTLEGVTNKSLANNIATLTTANNHSFVIEDYVNVSSVDTIFNGTYRLTGVTSNTISYFKLANNVTSTAASGNVTSSVRATYTGVLKDTANATWKLLSNIERRPDFNANLTNAVLDSLRVSTINADSFVTSAGLNVTDQANTAYAQANAAYGQANTAYGQANDAYSQANTAYGQANTAYGQANLAYSQANTARNQANTAYGQANAAYDQANSAFAAANNRVLKAGDTMTGLLNVANNLVVTGNVGIGTASPNSRLDVRGQVILGNAGNSANIANLISGTPPQLVAGWTIPAITWSPAATIEAVFARDGDMGIDILAGDTSSSLINFSDTNDEDVGQIEYDHATDYMRFRVNAGERLRIDSSGNVGIGTTNPSVKLHVVGSSILANNTSIDPDSYANQIVAGAIADGSGSFGLTSAIGGNAGTGDSWAIGHNGSGLFIGMGNGSADNSMQTYMQFDPNRNLYLVPDGGNVGIGSAIPTTKLDINFSNAGTYASGVSNNGIRIYNTSTATNQYVGLIFTGEPTDGNAGLATIYGITVGSGSMDMAFSTRNSATLAERMRLTSAGFVGIGTTSPSINFHIAGNNGNSVGSSTFWNFNFVGQEIQNASNTTGTVAGLALIGGSSRSAVAAIGGILESTSLSALGFFTGGSGVSGGTVPERMRITSAGNVGIGTTPTASNGILQIGQVPDGTSSSIGFPNGDNAVISARYSLVFQINHDNNQSGRVYSWKTGGKGYSDGTDLMTLTSAGNLGVGTSGPNARLHVRESGITAAAISTGWPAFNAESAAQSRYVLDLDAGGNGDVGTGGTGASATLIIGNYFDARGIITMRGAGGASPSDQGQGYGKDLMVKAGNSDNGNGLIGGRLFLAGGSGYSGNAFGTNYGAVILQPNSSRTGRVGIGTTQPPQKVLDVSGTTGIIASFGGPFGPGDFLGFHFGYSETAYGNDAYKKSALVFERTDNNNQGGNASGKIHFLLANYSSSSATSLNDSVMTIDSDANGTQGSVRVGIGTRSPTSTLQINGSLAKSSGSFKIDHPLPEKSNTHYLVHSFIEGPQADLIYRGRIELENGTAVVNIDVASGMSEGTFVALCRDVQCFTSNETTWDAVRGFVNGNILTIESQNSTSNATISWMVIGERQDKHMLDTEWTDENGKIVVEPLKETPNINVSIDVNAQANTK